MRLTVVLVPGFVDEIEVMRSLQKPRKFGIKASDGETYYFLAKPKDDLRKDARLMDLNGVINKLLKKHSESRRRQLRQYPSSALYLSALPLADIRTYSVVPINEECGLIEWVRGTLAFRAIIGKYWEARGVALWVCNRIAVQLHSDRPLAQGCVRNIRSNERSGTRSSR